MFVLLGGHRADGRRKEEKKKLAGYVNTTVYGEEREEGEEW